MWPAPKEKESVVSGYLPFFPYVWVGESLEILFLDLKYFQLINFTASSIY